MKHSTAVRWAHGILNGDGGSNYQRHGECDHEEDAAEQSIEGGLRRRWRDFVHRLMVCATHHDGHSISAPSSPFDATPATRALKLRVVDARAQLRSSSLNTRSAWSSGLWSRRSRPHSPLVRTLCSGVFIARWRAQPSPPSALRSLP